MKTRKPCLKLMPLFMLALLLIMLVAPTHLIFAEGGDGIRTQQEAVQWIIDRKNEGWAEDYDGSGGKPQCVDLIRYYIDYVVGYKYPIRGNAYDYVNHDGLPDGWYYTSEPMAGDIAVWDKWVDFANEWGHVALVEAINGDNFSYVDVNGETGKSGSGDRAISAITIFIRPFFTSTNPTPVPKTYIVTYNANGGSGAPSNQTKTHNVALTLSNRVPTKEGYEFECWTTDASGGDRYQPGDQYVKNANITLHAQWVSLGIPVNDENFPDPVFRKYIRDRFGDYLSDEEIENTTSIDVSFEDIQSLDGVCFFVALESLDCAGPWGLEEQIGRLTNLDVSGFPLLRHLDCSGHMLTSLDLSGCPLLNSLNCSDNQLTSLDLSTCLFLETLRCKKNKITNLDVRDNLALQYLSCGGYTYDKSQLCNLNVSECNALKELYCSWGQLSGLDVSGCTELKTLDCGHNQLTSLDVNGCRSLKYLQCWDNQLSNLDLSDCFALVELYCGNDYDFGGDYNCLTNLDVSMCPELRILWCEGNQLTSLDVSNNTLLYSVNMDDQLVSISSPLPTILDMATIVGKNKLERISYVGSEKGDSLAVYDPTTGMVELHASSFYYDYNTGNDMAHLMRVNVNIEPQEVIPPAEENLKAAAGITAPSTNVIMDVEKQDGVVTEAEKERIALAVKTDQGDLVIISAFDINVYAFRVDENGNEVTGSREAIKKLSSAVTLTFVTPGEAGKTYVVVREHINEKGEKVVEALETRDNGDGTVSVETNRFSLYYLVEAEEPQFLPGDINGDGKVNIFDVIRLLKKVTGEKVETFAGTDVNGDGKMNIFDVIRLLKKVTGENVEVH